MSKILSVILMVVLWLPGLSQAAIEAYEFKDDKMEADYQQLIHELRCLVCQNQNLSGSDADLARDLRRQTHELLMKGNSQDQVIDYMVERYGDFVLYRPQFKMKTLLLWLGPFFLLLIVVGLVLRKFRHQQALVKPDESALERAKQLLSENRDNS